MQTFFACFLLLFLREKDNSMEIPIKVDYSAIKAAQAEIERLDEALEELVVTDSKNIEEMQRLQDALNVQKAIVGENVSAIINLADARRHGGNTRLRSFSYGRRRERSVGRKDKGFRRTFGKKRAFSYGDHDASSRRRRNRA